MKEFKIDKKIEAQVEVMFTLGQQMGELKERYPSCFSLLKKQFGFADYSGDNCPDNADNFQIRLYAEIVHQHNLNDSKKARAIKKSLTKAL